jgi:hypothetical protein
MDNQAPDNKSTGSVQPFESDAEKLAHRHLSDPDHVITEEEMKSIRVGMPSAPDQPTEEAIRESNEKIADHKADSDDDTTPGAQKITPWDVIGP